MHVLLVSDRVVADLRGAGDHERGCAVELRCRLGTGRLFQPLERLRADHAEAPRVREVVVRRPAGELEQLVERRTVDGLARVRLVRAAGADRVFDFHGDDLTLAEGPPPASLVWASPSEGEAFWARQVGLKRHTLTEPPPAPGR